MEHPAQRPLTLILARNLCSSIATATFVVNAPGDLVFYNDAAAALLGRRFEENGAMPAEEWVATFGPLDERGQPIPLEDQPITRALRASRAAHSRHRVRSVGGEQHDVEVTGMPLIGADGFQGAMICFWPTGEAVR